MKKFIFGVMLTAISFICALVFFIVSIVVHPFDSYNQFTGMLASFLGNGLLIPFITSVLLFLVGLFICGYEAYKKK